MRLVVTCLLVWCVATSAMGQEAPDAEARRLFDEGLALSESNRWSEAADRFERSLAIADRPGTRFNLVNAYVELGRPLEVVRHALAFLSLPAEPHRAEARANTQSALDDAARQLAVLTTQSVPAGTVLMVDGDTPAVRDASRVFVLPGLHRLEARIPGAAPEAIELHLGRGQELPWPRQAHFAPAQPPPVVPVAEAAPPIVAPVVVPRAPEPVPLESAWRSRLSIVSGTLGASLELTAVGLLSLTQHRANELSGSDPTEEGFVTASDEYWRSANAVAPLAITGGALMAQAVATGPRSSRWGSRATAFVALAGGAALVAAGVLLLVREPEMLENTNVEAPSRQAGAVLVSSAGPFVSYGTSFLVHWYRSPRGVKLTLGRR